MTSEKGTFLQKKVGRCHMITIVMMAMLILAIVIGVILIVTLRPDKPSDTLKATTDEKELLDSECLDVAIIGAGAGGTYTAYKLRNRGMKITIFEYLNRVGGRVYSPAFPPAPGTFLELGAMRFAEERHLLTLAIVKELNLPIVPFTLRFGISSETIWYVRGKHLRNTELYDKEKLPYYLDDDQYKSRSRVLWDIYNKAVNLSGTTKPSLDDMYTLFTTDGVPVYKMSNENLLGQYASKEVAEYFLNVFSWSSNVGKMAAVRNLRLSTNFPGDPPSTLTVSTVDGGYDRIIKTMVNNFTDTSSKHKLMLNRQLVAIERRQGGGYYLRIRETQTVDGITTPTDNYKRMCAKKVIITGQPATFREIDFPVFIDNKEIMKNLNGVWELNSGRIFLAYKTQWWKTNNSDITHTISDRFNRQTYDWQTGSNNVSIIMASYHDGENTAYWRELSKFGSPIPGSLPGENAVTDAVKNRLEQYLSEIYNYPLEDIPNCVGGGMYLYDTYPFNKGWGYMAPGFDERKSRVFAHKPSPVDDVHIVTGSYGPEGFTSWIEGPLLNAEDVISKYFN